MTQSIINPASMERLDYHSPNLDNLSTLPPFNHTSEEANKMQETHDNIVSLPIIDLEALRDKASSAAHVLSAAMASDSVKRIDKAKVDAQSSVDEYNAAFINQLFDRYLKSDTPVLEAATAGFWRKMRLVTKTVDGAQCVEIGYTPTVIDLVGLEKAAGERQIMHKGSWRIVAEKLTFQYAMRATKDIGGDVDRMKRLYDVSEFARDDRHFWEDGKRPADPVSNKQLIAVTQKALDAILYIEDADTGYNSLRVNTHDLHYILYTVFKKGKGALSISMPRTATIIAALTEVSYRLVNGLAYTSEYKEIEKKEAVA